MSVRLAPQLEACTAPNDEVAVTGALRNVLTAGLPALLVDEGYEVLLVQEGFRSVAALRTLKERHLLDMGLDRGTASVVWECILPPAAPGVVLGVAASDVAENTTRASRLGPMRPFPAVDAGGLPDLNGMAVYGTGLQAHVWPAITDETKAAFAALEADANADISGRQAGGRDDEVVFGAMVNGPGALPDRTLLLIPADLKIGHLGMGIYQHLQKAVRTKSDEADGISLEWFQAPDPVEVPNRAMLGSVLQQWKEYRKKLPVLPELVYRLPVERLISKLKDVVADVSH